MENPVRITITAGMDGDEYTGIEAARVVEKKYRTQKNIVVLPLINEAGYKHHTSWSPIDNKYPKFVFPGSHRGTHTAQRMYELFETYIKHTDLWIDLHGGATNEILTPFLWLYRSRHRDIRAIHQRVIETTSAPIVVYDRHPFMNYSALLDKLHIAHILMECGDQGTARKEDVRALITWVDEIIHPTATTHRNPLVYTSVRYVFDVNKRIENGQLLWKRTDTDIPRGEVAAAYALR